MIAIVYGHPYGRSFNSAILAAVLDKLSADDREYSLLDLYADNFEPAVSEQDLAVYHCGETRDALAMKYMEILKKTDEIVFIYPVWWGIEPAIIKGFYDKVLLKDRTWHYAADGALAPLLNIGKTIVITTSEAPSALFAPYFEDYLPNHIFNAVGMRNPVWKNLDNIVNGGEQRRKDFLDQVVKLI